MGDVDVLKAINLALPSWAIVDGPYRYALGRGYGDKIVTWVMLNPSVADAMVDDPTIRKVRKFSLALTGGQFTRFVVVNLYAWRATKPATLSNAAYGPERCDVVGPMNVIAVGDALLAADHVVVAWGANKGPAHDGAVARVMGQIERRGIKPLCLGRTGDGSPCHPLMLPYSTAFEVYGGG